MNKTLFIALFATITLASCGDDQPSGQDGSSSSASIPPGIFAKERPAGAKPLSEVKKTARDGDDVVVSAVDNENGTFGRRHVIDNRVLEACDEPYRHERVDG